MKSFDAYRNPGSSCVKTSKDANGLWQTTRCSNERPFICKKGLKGKFVHSYKWTAAQRPAQNVLIPYIALIYHGKFNRKIILQFLFFQTVET